MHSSTEKITPGRNPEGRKRRGHFHPKDARGLAPAPPREKGGETSHRQRGGGRETPLAEKSLDKG
jgi:hypothetical protein